MNVTKHIGENYTVETGGVKVTYGEGGKEMSREPRTVSVDTKPLYVQLCQYKAIADSEWQTGIAFLAHRDAYDMHFIVSIDGVRQPAVYDYRLVQLHSFALEFDELYLNDSWHDNVERAEAREMAIDRKEEMRDNELRVLREKVDYYAARIERIEGHIGLPAPNQKPPV